MQQALAQAGVGLGTGSRISGDAQLLPVGGLAPLLAVAGESGHGVDRRHKVLIARQDLAEEELSGVVFAAAARNIGQALGRLKRVWIEPQGGLEMRTSIAQAARSEIDTPA